MTRIHFYGFSPEDGQTLVSAAHCIVSFDKNYQSVGWYNGTDYLINGRHTISCWRTKTGNISVRFIK